MTPEYLIRDDGKLFCYNKSLAENPRMSPYTPPAPEPEPVEEVVEEREPHYCDEYLWASNRKMIKSYIAKNYGVVLDITQPVDVVREEAAALIKERENGGNSADNR